jgi:anti-sigma regulatory factor (Ser/Thr protein kinase)
MEHAVTPCLADAVVGEQYQLRIPTQLEWIEPTVDYLTNRAAQGGVVEEKRAGRLMLALHEALTNSVVHGNLEIGSDLKERGDQAFLQALAARCADPHYSGRHVDIRVVYDGLCTHWVLTDQGQGFDVAAALQRLDGEGGHEDRPSGRGLVMIRAFVDEVRWEQGGRRIILTMRKASDEKRMGLRRPLHQSVRVAPIVGDTVDWDAAHDALARDISAEGMSLVQPGPEPAGRILITIPVAGGAVSVPAEVRRAQTLEDNLVEVGCRFETTPTPPADHPADGTGEPGESIVGDALAALVERLSPRERIQHDRRAASRIPYTACVWVRRPGAEPIRGFARNLSRGGIAFVSTVAVPLETVRLGLTAEDGRAPLHLPARVSRCSCIMDGFYDVAARFLDV